MLTPRQAEVTQLLANDKTGKQVALELGLSPHTIDSHVKRAQKLTGTSTRTGLVAFALRRGLIE